MSSPLQKKRVGADLIEFAAPEKAEFVSGEHD